MRKSLKKICAACGAVFLFASCATTKLRPVYVTNTTKVQLLPTDAVKTEIDDYYLFEGVFGDKVFSSLAYLTMNSKETTVVMLSGLGVTLGEIIYDGKICTIDSAVIPDKLKPEYIVHDGDVIFSWSGSLLVDLWCGGTCGLNQHLFKVTSSTYDKWFYYAWTNHHLQKFAAIAADMATTMGHIKREELSKAEVLIPSQSDYDRIGGLLAPLYDLVIANRIENRKLASLRDELLPQLMSGQLDVSEVSL